MSTRTFDTRVGSNKEARGESASAQEDTPVRVHAGWNPPVGLFLVIYRADGLEGPCVETLYSNIDAPGYGPPGDLAIGESPGSIKRRLRDFAIQWPEAWYNDLLADYEVGKDAQMGAPESVEGTCAGPAVKKNYGVHDRL